MWGLSNKHCLLTLLVLIAGKLSESEEEMEMEEEMANGDGFDQSQSTYYDGQAVEQYQVSLFTNNRPLMY